MADIFNDRVNEAQAQLQVRAERLKKLVKQSQDKKVSAAFKEGVNLLSQMISGQSELIDKLVFETPKTRFEQMRNLQLTTGGPNETPTAFIKTATDAMDAMLAELESMVR